MEEDYSEDLLIGTKFADQAEAWIQQNAKKAGEWYKDASADQAGIGDDILRLLGGGAKNIAWASQLPGIKQGFQVLGAAGHYGGILGGKAAEAVGIDPRLGGFAGNIIGDVAFGGAVAKAGKVARAVRAVDQLPPLTSGGILNPGPGAAGLKPTGLRKISKVATAGSAKQDDLIRAAKLQSKDKIVYSGKGGKTFRSFPGDEGAEYFANAYKHWDTHGTMRGYPRAKISGEEYMPRPGSKVDVSKRTGLKLDPVSRRKSEGIKRLEPGKEDIPSIKRVFDAIADKNPKYNKATVQSYVETNRTVVKKVTDAITDFNNNVKATQKGWTNDDLLSLEHIFDVEFHNRLKAELPSFPGRGANELTNLKAISYALNSRTGALNKKIKVQDALIDTVKKGQGLPNYEKSIAQFIYEDIGEEVKKFTKDDWKKFTGEVLSRPDSTIQDVLVDMIRNKPKKRLLIKKPKLQWDDTAQTAFKQMKASNLPEARWRKSNIEFTWAPKDLGGKGRGYIDVIKDVAGDDDYFALQKQFFEKIKTLPSGTEWTLEADTAQKYRLYKRMFRGDPRITPGGDTKLLKKRGIDHFVLRIP